MIERVQPVVKGVDEKGEFIWGVIPMPFWQMAMFPVRYIGDFAAHWAKVGMLAHFGIDMDENTASTSFLSFVPWQVQKKYADQAKERRGKGD